MFFTLLYYETEVVMFPGFYKKNFAGLQDIDIIKKMSYTVTVGVVCPKKTGKI